MMATYVAVAPFTKVEESFNLQAMHDILYHDGHLENYDHLEFPGVVPRTFLGALVVAFLSSPLVVVLRWAALPKLWAQYIVRMALGALVVCVLSLFRRSVSSTLGAPVARAWCLLTFLQFHVLFYASRPLPNTFALAMVTLALAQWNLRRPRWALSILVTCAIIFRCDMILLAGTVALTMLLSRQLALHDVLQTGIFSLVLALCATVGVDSIFWQRSLWPEGEVLWFNTVLNRSKEWGVSPFHWYFTSAIPRAMLGGLLLVPIGLAIERRLWRVTAPLLVFVTLYSYLPHKELRFILPVVPALNVSAASAIARIFANRHKGPQQKLAWVTVAGLLAATAVASGMFALASVNNYPGGYAFRTLHNDAHLHDCHHTAAAADATGACVPTHEETGGADLSMRELCAPSVHIDVAAAMTGVSRFGEGSGGSGWRYSKVEGLTLEDLYQCNFTHLLSERKRVPGYCRADTTNSFAGIGFSARPPFVKLKTAPAIFIHRRCEQRSCTSSSPAEPPTRVGGQADAT
eukprot:jgi/Mesvir1/16738/Mv15121-RA.2